MSIKLNGLEFPAAPREESYLDLPTSGAPQVANRWHRVPNQQVPSGPVDLDVFWRGACLRCGNGIWSTPQDDIVNVAAYIADTRLATEVIRDGVAYRCCKRCSGHADEVVSLGQASPDENKGFVQWPDGITATSAKARAEREAKKAEWTVERPTAPAEGAYVVAGKALTRFERFADGKVVTESGVHEMDGVQVLVPAVYGVLHPSVIVLPFLAGITAEPVPWRVVRWEGVNVTIHSQTGITKTISANGIAVPAPCLDPSTETPEARAERLEWALRRVTTGLHHRMVAEGVARDWCSTFDPILSSSGLAPRKAQQFYLVTMRVESDRKLSESELAGLLASGWRNTWNYQKLHCVDVQAEYQSSTPMLSL